MEQSLEEGTITVFVRATMYGIYTVIFAHSLRWLLLEDAGWKLRKVISWRPLAVTSIIFVFLTTDLVLNVETLAVFSQLGTLCDALCIASDAIECIIILTVDAILIHRCWVIHKKSLRVISPPLILWLVSLVAAFVAVALELIGLAQPKAQGLWAQSRQWMVFYSCSILVNLYTTSAIVHRILSVATIRGTNSNRLHKSCRILVESGILYTLSSTLNLFASSVDTESRCLYIRLTLDAINISMTGITSDLILIRVGQNRARDIDPLEIVPSMVFQNEKAQSD